MSFLNVFFIEILDYDSVNVKFSDIEYAFRKGKEVVLIAPDKAKLPAQSFGIDEKSGRPFVEFCKISGDEICTYATVCRLTKPDQGDVPSVSVEKKVISTKPIELERVDADKPLYKSLTKNIAITVNDIVNHGGAVMIRADGQTYPYITGNQIEVIFGRIDPYTGEFVTFVAASTDTFTRYSREV